MINPASQHTDIRTATRSTSSGGATFHETVHVDMLGRFRIWTVEDGAEKGIEQIANRKVALLLAYLTFYAHRAHPRDAVAELLWPGMESEAARNNLRVSLSRLNRLLADRASHGPRKEPLLRTGDRAFIALNPARWAPTDVARFEAALLRADSAKTAGAAAESSALEAAVSVYGGPLLPGYDDPWVDAERQRLEERYLSALRRLVRLCVESRQFDRAFDYARRALSVDPLRQGAHRDLMHLHLLTGRPDAALRQLRDLESLLSRSSSGVALSPATKALGEQIAAAQAAGGPSSGASEAAAAASTSFALTPREPPAPPSSVPAPLPTAMTQFFGRQAEIADLRRMLLGDERSPLSGNPLRRRSVTLVGVGGSGKTRLAQELAQGLWRAGPFAGSVWWLSVSDLSASDSLLTALGRIVNDVATAPRLRAPTTESEPDTPLMSVATALEAVAQRASPTGMDAGADTGVLLVLDNAETLLDECASLVGSLLDLAPSLTCLVTSRVPLGLHGEQTYPVPMLRCALSGGDDTSQQSAPPAKASAPDALLELPAIQLFVDRARLVRPHFTLTAQNARTVASLCARLDGSPLAIELAAAWTRTMTLEQMLNRLASGRFDLLASNEQDVPRRHRSLWSAIESSERLLSVEARCLFRRLSVFRGGFTLGAAQAICGASFSVDRVVTLVGHSLVLVREDGRFDLFETLREYGDAQLSPAERLAVQRLHARYYLSVIDGSHSNEIDDREAATKASIDADADNVQSALDRCTNATDPEDVLVGLTLAAVRWRYWLQRGFLSEGSKRLERIMIRAKQMESLLPGSRLPSKDWFRCLLGAATLAISKQADLAADALFEDAVQVAQMGELPVDDLASALLNWGTLKYNRGDLDAARLLWERCARISVEAHPDGDTNQAFAVLSLGSLTSREGDYEAARIRYSAAHDIACRMLAVDPESRAVQRTRAVALRLMGFAEMRMGSYAVARRHLTEGRELLEGMGERGILVRQRRFDAEWLLVARRDVAGATAAYQHGLAEAWEIGEVHSVIWIVDGLVRVGSKCGEHPRRTAMLLGSLQALCEHYHSRLTAFETLQHSSIRSDLEALAGADTVADAWDRGYALTPEEVVAFALRPASDEDP
jgi:predicted ATPase/DNA-binding SARP family transcriptional activator